MEVGKWPAERKTASRNDNKCPADLTSHHSRFDSNGKSRPISSWTQNTSFKDSTTLQGSPLHASISVGTCRELVSRFSITIEEDGIYSVPTRKTAPINGPVDILIIRDSFHKPQKLFVFPEVITIQPGEKISVSVMCMDPLFFLHHGMSLAHAFLIPKDSPQDVPSNPQVIWVQVMGDNKSIYKCDLFCKGEKINRPGMLDTGAAVTLTARSKWSPQWELEPVAGTVSGIGGVATSWQAKRNVVISGPEGKVAIVRPFVVRAAITLWGRDVLSQWGASIHIPCQDF